MLWPRNNDAFLLTDASLREFSNFLKNLEEQREIMVSGGVFMNTSVFRWGEIWVYKLALVEVLVHLSVDE